MTKQEFVAEVARRSQLTSRDAGKAVDAFLETITDTLKGGGDVAFTGFGKFSTQHRAARTGVNPRNPSREGAHPGGARFRSSRPAARSRPPSRAAEPSARGHVSSEDRRGAASAAPRAFRGRLGRAVALPMAQDSSGRMSPSRTSPTGSPRPSSASAASSSSGSIPVPDLLPVELRGEAVLGREHAAAACARFCCGIVDAVAPYAVAVKPQSAFFEALGADGVARARGGVRVRARRGAPRHRRREARRHRLDRARVCGRVRRAARRRAAARRRGHRQPVPRPRLARAVPRGVPPRRRRASSAS